MKMMKTFIFLAFFLALSLAQTSNVCPLSSNNGGFEATSTASLENPCGLSQTCCNADYFSQISDKTDPFSLASARLVGASNACLEKISALSCAPCSAHQDSISDSRSYTGYFRVCHDYCDSLLETCGSAVIDGTQVEDAFTSGEKFCETAFADLAGNLTILPSLYSGSDSNCYMDNLPECTMEDLHGFYTECDLTSNSRSYIYRWKGHNCYGGVQLPSPVSDLPCYQKCEPGEFLPTAATDCKSCDPGTYSVGGGYYFEQWKEWPSEFEWKSYCESTDGIHMDQGTYLDDCAAWVLNDTFIEVADTLDDSQNAVLLLSVNLVQDGSVTFVFAVNAEPHYDGLNFEIDDQLMMTYHSNVGNYQKRTFPLKQGLHVIKWYFFKDENYSGGMDQAYIRSIEVLGVKYADNSCSECLYGQYSEGGAARCSRCPQNTFSENVGVSECTPCPSSQYSYPGEYSCWDREECKATDVAFSYTKCRGGDQTRDKIYNFLEPVICDSENYDTPLNEMNIACASCNPGQYRDSSSCMMCASGTYSDKGAQSCTDCGAGSYAKKSLSLTQFDSFDELPGVSTFCQGQCATPGFRLLSDDIDSGEGHGQFVDVFLQLEVDLEDHGEATFNASVFCYGYCRVYFVDVNVTGGSQMSHYFYKQSPPEEFKMYLSKGPHTIQVIFSKFTDIEETRRDSRVVVHDILITGVSTGGAQECTSCPAGYFSQSRASTCEPCPPGTFSEAGDATCSLCPEGTFTTDEATRVCTPCGLGTGSLPDRTDCDNTCTYSPEEGLSYDLSALEANGDMYGPIWDVQDHAFFFNPCSKVHKNRTCVDEDGNPMNTHTCQQLPLGYAMDLGSIAGYLPFNDTNFAADPNHPERSGLVMTFDGGSLGCADPINGLSQFPRSSTISFICDPSAGIGYPEALEPVEYAPCAYQFKWKSLYACPACTVDDYNVVFDSCIDGYSTTTYVPQNFPNRCYGGVQIPAPEQIPCSSISKNCSAGTFFPVNSAQEDECVNAPVGSFTIGGGVYIDRFDSWDLMPIELNERKSSWQMVGEYARSGKGDTALVMDVTLVQTGYLSFRYKIVGEGLHSVVPGGGFFLHLDNDTRISAETSSGYNLLEQMYLLSPGEHQIKWRFIGGSLPSSSSRGYYVVIDEIKVGGTKYGARQTIPCREGQYQDKEGQTRCRTCPPNTRSPGGSENCFACQERTYSLRGSSDCSIETMCQERDYSEDYSICGEDGMMELSYSALSPKTCYDEDSDFLYNAGTRVACLDCSEGFYLKDGICTACPYGTYLKDGECVAVSAGYHGIQSITYFSSSFLPPHKPTTGLPRAFSTSCSGNCGSNGWRKLNNSVESGFHSIQNEVESVLVLTDHLLHDGAITFTYMLSALKTQDMAEDLGLPGLEFFIDGQRGDKLMRYHPNEDTPMTVTFPLNAGSHTFKWVFHQPLGTNRHKRMILSELTILGSESGSSVVIEKCDRGYYSEEASSRGCRPCGLGTESGQGAESCTDCDSNSFTDKEGSADCKPCPTQLVALPDRTGCDTNGCIFEDHGVKFDLSALNHLVVIEDEDQDVELKMKICNTLTKEESRCFDEDNKFIDGTFACMINYKNGVDSDVGHYMNIIVDHVGPHNELPQLRLRYTSGACGSFGNAVQYMDVTFVCDPDQVSYVEPELIKLEECTTELQWSHISACVVCDPEVDYEEQVGECKDGKATVVNVRTSNCNGPLALQSSKKCDATVGFSLTAIIATASLFMILGFFMIVFLIRNKRMADKYSSLINASSVGGKEFGLDASSQELGDAHL